MLNKLSNLFVVQPMLDPGFTYVEFVKLEEQQADGEQDGAEEKSIPSAKAPVHDEVDEQTNSLLLQALKTSKRVPKTTHLNGHSSGQNS